MVIVTQPYIPPYWFFDNFFALQALNLKIITHFFIKKPNKFADKLFE